MNEHQWIISLHYRKHFVHDIYVNTELAVKFLTLIINKEKLPNTGISGR